MGDQEPHNKAKQFIFVDLKAAVIALSDRLLSDSIAIVGAKNLSARPDIIVKRPKLKLAGQNKTPCKQASDSLPRAQTLHTTTVIHVIRE